MLAKDITDCDNCPICGKVCESYMYRTGIPNEPPCCVWSDDWIVDEDGIYTPEEWKRLQEIAKIKELLI